jgi:hypothetical protein
MKRIVLFRFHKRLKVCLNRLEMLHELNPNLEIFGLGEEKIRRKAEKFLGNRIEGLYCTKGKTARWKWLHGDLSVRQWFIDYGHRLDFDALHVIEWDMLFFEPLAKAYRKIPSGGMGLTGLRLLKPVESRWNWTSKEPYRGRWLKLLEYAKKRYGYEDEPYGCIGTGPCIPRRFLEEYSEIKVPELVHDELDYPLFAQIFGIRLYDTGFFRWFDEDWYRFFNAEKMEIKKADILSELGKRDGRRVFHPYYREWDLPIN